MRISIIKIFIFFTFYFYNIDAQVDKYFKNYNYKSTLFTQYELKENWSGINSLLNVKDYLGLSFNNSIINKLNFDKNTILDDTLRFTLLLYTGGETGDPLFHKYTRPNENIPNKNKIVPSFNISLSKKRSDLSVQSNIDFQGYFITGSNKIDNLIYQLDPIMIDKNNLDLKIDGKIQYHNIYFDWDIKNMQGWNFLPFEENLIYNKNTSLKVGLGFDSFITKNKITYETYSYEIVKPTFKLFNVFNLQLQGKVNILKNKQNNHLFNYSIGKIVSNSKLEYENQKELGSNLYYSFDYAGLIDLGSNIQLNSLLGYQKNKVGNKGVKLNLSLNRIDNNSNYKIGLIYEPVEYKYEKLFFDYKWELKDLLFVNEYLKLSMENYLKQICFIYSYKEENININIGGNYTNINNYYQKKYRQDANSLIRYYDEIQDKKFGELSSDVRFKIKDFTIGTGIKQSFTNLEEIPNTILFAVLDYNNKLGMYLKLEYYYYSETNWDEDFSSYSVIFEKKSYKKNIFNFTFKQSLENINLKGIDLGLLVYNMFDKNNQYLPLSTSIGRTIVIFIKSDFKLNL